MCFRKLPVFPLFYYHFSLFNLPGIFQCNFQFFSPIKYLKPYFYSIITIFYGFSSVFFFHFYKKSSNASFHQFFIYTSIKFVFPFVLLFLPMTVMNNKIPHHQSNHSTKSAEISGNSFHILPNHNLLNLLLLSSKNREYDYNIAYNFPKISGHSKMKKERETCRNHHDELKKKKRSGE